MRIVNRLLRMLNMVLLRSFEGNIHRQSFGKRTNNPRDRQYCDTSHLGISYFFLFLYIMFEGTFVLGDYPMQGIEWLVDQLGNLIRNNMAEGPLKDLLIDGIISGSGRCYRFPAEYPHIILFYFYIGRFGVYGTRCIYHG